MSNKFKVLWVYQLVSAGGIGSKVQAGQKPALCFKGRKNMYCVAAGHPVRVLKREAKDFDKLREVTKGSGLYPVSDAINTFREIAGRNGITRGADAILTRAENTALSTDDIEDSLTNEEDNAMTNENTAPVSAEGSEPTATTGKKEKTVSKKKAVKKAAAPKKSAAPKKAKAPKGPSRISKAVDYMKDEVKKEGGQKNLERGWRKELFDRAAKKFDLSPTTCSIQYNKQVLNKGTNSGAGK